MAELTIKDTGYASTADSGNPISISYRAYSGEEISLKGISVTTGSKGNYDNSPTLNNFGYADVNFGSIENRNVSIKGVINEEDSTDIGLMYALSQLPETVGYKMLYYKSLGTDNAKQLVTMMSNGRTLNSTLQTRHNIDAAYNYLTVKFISFTTTQKAGSPIIGWSLDGIVLKYT